MKNNRLNSILGCIVLLLAISSCIEPFEIETQGFEGVLVVDARLTNEEKQHQIILSRARPFEQDSITPEINAQVSIKDEVGNNYEFEEVSPGKYESVSLFRAEQNKAYELDIISSDGNSYNSESVQLPESTAMWGANDAFKEDDLLGELPFSNVSPYFAKLTVCGDCTVLGSIEIPDFWII